MKCSCDNCDWTGEESALGYPLKDVPDLHVRLEPGGEVPAGECPECGALAYLVPEHAESTVAMRREIANLKAALTACRDRLLERRDIADDDTDEDREAIAADDAALKLAEELIGKPDLHPFDPKTMIPETDADVELVWSSLPLQDADKLRGIYRSQRDSGLSPIQAYDAALYQHGHNLPQVH